MIKTLLLWISAALLALAATSVSAQTLFTVTNTNDSGAGSLRQAILDAVAAPTGAHDNTGNGSAGATRRATLENLACSSPAPGMGMPAGELTVFVRQRGHVLAETIARWSPSTRFRISNVQQ